MRKNDAKKCTSLIGVANSAKKAYELAFGEEFNVSTGSLYIEIIGHQIADSVAQKNRNGLLSPLWERIIKSTRPTIDSGDGVIHRDVDRPLWDILDRIIFN